MWILIALSIPPMAMIITLVLLERQGADVRQSISNGTLKATCARRKRRRKLDQQRHD